MSSPGDFQCLKTWHRYPCPRNSDGCHCIRDAGHEGLCLCACFSTAVKDSADSPESFDFGDLDDQRFGGTLDETGE